MLTVCSVDSEHSETVGVQNRIKGHITGARTGNSNVVPTIVDVQRDILRQSPARVVTRQPVVTRRAIDYEFNIQTCCRRSEVRSWCAVRHNSQVARKDFDDKRVVAGRTIRDQIDIDVLNGAKYA